MGIKSFAIFALSATAIFAQDIAGQWQGTLTTPQRSMRLVMKVTKDSENLRAVFFNIDQNGQPHPGNPVSFQGGTYKATIPSVNATFEGKLSADGTSITGTFTQGSPLPLTLARATTETAWTIPDPPAPPRTMAPDAKPTFEVATIKPSVPDSPGRGINVGRGGGNAFTTLNQSLADIIIFAYAIHPKQLTGAPSWTESERWDILAKPDTEGVPNATQLRSMVKELLKERFGLEFHREKKELAAYVMTVDKAGLKITKVEGNRGNLPGFGGRGPGAVGVRNAAMDEFADFLQARILDRPVVDQTGLKDRYDFQFEWRPEPGPNAPATLPQNIEDRPDLITAIRQQLGLKIESTKAPVDVMVVDKVTKPTAN